MTGTEIVGIGAAVPERELTNEELGAILGCEGSWIEARTGIRTRRIAGASETAATLGTAAAEEALRDAHLDGADIDLVVCATITPAWRFPATASLIQSALSSQAAAFDLNAGCCGFLYALAQAESSIRSGAAARVLVVGAEVMSGITDYSDPKTAILFGDAAGAVVLEAREGSAPLGPFLLFSDGSRPELLHLDPATDKVRMEGREVYRAAVTSMAGSVEELLRRTATDPDDVRLVIAHQANQRILEAVADRLGLPQHRMFSNIDRYGNTSSASIPLALCEAHHAGALAEGDLVVVTGFGAGFAWGAGLLQWGSLQGATASMQEASLVHA